MKYMFIFFALMGVFLVCHWTHLSAIVTGMIMAVFAVIMVAKK